ncbi:metal-dependent hydrolase [Halobacterium zhouii]|uniref:metal-dependent hydrolase n=1 Tax=Halobacterium zhouii TaxID=2902624 RepID=UPI001E4B8D70|nr:metal-dependent hydrolase [Halobacterium zhouii]
MMATTHALMGLALSAVVTLVAPEYTPVAAASGLAGGAFPDLDLYTGHRRTLHFPVYFTIAAVAAAGVAVLAPGAWTVGAAVFLTAAGLHSASDALGGGLELKPWRATSEQAVYSHFHGRWIRPRRWVRYDGAPEDLALATAVGVPASLAYGPRIQGIVAGALVVSAGYVLVRKRLPTLAAWLLGTLPDDVRRRIPERFVP